MAKSTKRDAGHTWRSLRWARRVSQTVFLVLFLSLQKKGLFTAILRMLGRLRLRLVPLERSKTLFRETDDLISGFYRPDNPALWGVCLLYLAWAMIWILEVYLTFRLLGISDVSWLQCYLLVTLGSLSTLLPGLPAALGTYEITYVSLFALLSIDLEAGIAVILIRRAIGVLWAGAGVIPLLVHRGGRFRDQDLPGPSSG